jgi:hypothetical protein
VNHKWLLWHTSRDGNSSCLFNSDNGSHPIRIVDLPARLSTEVHMFTVNFAFTMFGGLFYYGLLQMIPTIIIFTNYVANHSNDGRGVGLCLGGFAFCVILEMLVGSC